MRPEFRFLIILPLTIAVELAFFLLCKFLILKKSLAPVSLPSLIAGGAIATSFTLPYVWFVLYLLVRDPTAYLIASEAFAVIVEGLLYCFLLKLELRTGFLVSLICNAASGLILFQADRLLLSLTSGGAAVR